MALVLELPDDVEGRLLQVAETRGIGAMDLARQLIERSLPDAEDAAEDAAMLALFAAWDAEDAAIDPSELAAERAEWEEISARLDARQLSIGNSAP